MNKKDAMSTDQPSAGVEPLEKNGATAEQPDEEEADSGRKTDPELKMMGAMVRLLDKLEFPARCRVVTWLASRYQNITF